MNTRECFTAFLLLLPGIFVASAGSKAAIVIPDIPACASVVHIVDSLLLPQVRMHLP